MSAEEEARGLVRFYSDQAIDYAERGNIEGARQCLETAQKYLQRVEQEQMEQVPDTHCPTHPHVRLELVDAATGERTCPACVTGAAPLTAPPLPVRVACAHTGGRCVYRPAHGMEICKDCGLTVPAREA
jgi:hypothetical protein